MLFVQGQGHALPRLIGCLQQYRRRIMCSLCDTAGLHCLAAGDHEQPCQTCVIVIEQFMEPNAKNREWITCE